MQTEDPIKTLNDALNRAKAKQGSQTLQSKSAATTQSDTQLAQSLAETEAAVNNLKIAMEKRQEQRRKDLERFLKISDSLQTMTDQYVDMVGGAHENFMTLKSVSYLVKSYFTRMSLKSTKVIMWPGIATGILVQNYVRCVKGLDPVAPEPLISTLRRLPSLQRRIYLLTCSAISMMEDDLKYKLTILNQPVEKKTGPLLWQAAAQLTKTDGYSQSYKDTVLAKLKVETPNLGSPVKPRVPEKSVSSQPLDVQQQVLTATAEKVIPTRTVLKQIYKVQAVKEPFDKWAMSMIQKVSSGEVTAEQLKQLQFKK